VRSGAEAVKISPRRWTLKIIGIVLCAAASSLAALRHSPPGTGAKDIDPRPYRFTIDYTSSDIKGRITRRQRVRGEYTRGPAGGDATWANVTVAEGSGASEPLGPPQRREFMEGFRYRRRGDFSDSMKPDFFKGFPPTAVMERNLVWDAEMFELFGPSQLPHLKPNEPYHVVSNNDVKMPGLGTFHNRDVELTLTGRSQRNGQDCAVIEYRAYFNPLEIATGGMTLKGRSHYWGLIWVSLTRREVEYATLYEDVLGELKLPGETVAQVIDVFRSGVFEPASRE
jgi:hypothetical protein